MAMIEFDAFSFSFSFSEADSRSSAPADCAHLRSEASQPSLRCASSTGAALPAAGKLSLRVEEGAFCLFTGSTGCGKTTLLRACKPELAPCGEYSGSLDVCGVRLVDNGRVTGAMDSETSARSIGFVMQDPGAQIVCDTVWHELAFGLENLGTDPDLMRRRVAEVAHYLGIAPWVDRRCADLSGGQAQLLNLAAALVLRPPLLLLDEPLAQLDPAARRQFVGLLSRVQRELGLTVVVATHLPEEWDGVAEQVVSLDGEVARLAWGDGASPTAATGVRPAREGGVVPAAAPQGNLAAAFGCSGAQRRGPCEPASDCPPAQAAKPPIPVQGSEAGDGAKRLAERGRGGSGREPSGSACVVEGRDLFFRFGSEGPWVLRGLDLAVRGGTVHAVVGGNGCGKTTLLRVLAGELRPRRGKVRNALSGAQAFLPQDPKAVFVCDSVDEELCEWQARAGYSDGDVAAIQERFGLAGFGHLHPFDLSGGQRQMLALAKMLLARPRLLLLDEPTKGLDTRACAQVVKALREFCDAGGTVVVATHDLDFTAACADGATLLFDGQAACTQPVPQFFEDNLIWRPRERSRLAQELA